MAVGAVCGGGLLVLLLRVGQALGCDHSVEASRVGWAVVTD